MVFNSFDISKIFSKDWYNEYYQKADISKIHSSFCERVYGIDLCQHGMMDKEELDLLITFLKPNSKILEIGCSNGYISEYIHDNSSCSLLGLDFSNVAISQAISRSKEKSKTLHFRCVDLTKEDAPGVDFDYIILVDSIYFLAKAQNEEVKEVVLRLSKKLSDMGKLIITSFHYKPEKATKEFCHKDTPLGKALKDLELAYTTHDCTKNLKNHWLKNYQHSKELKNDFIAEGNEFLYEARLAENVHYSEKVKKDEMVRYLYVIEKM